MQNSVKSCNLAAIKILFLFLFFVESFGSFEQIYEDCEGLSLKRVISFDFCFTVLCCNLLPRINLGNANKANVALN